MTYSATVLTVPETRPEAHAKAMRALGKLPPFSPVLTRLMGTLASEEVSFGKVSDLIEKDTVMAGNVLRLVNSPLYACRGTINSVRHAVSIMGIAKLRNTVMTLSIARMMNHRDVPPSWSAAQFNLHATASAILADLLAAEMDVPYPEGAFAAGLLQNVGMLLIAISHPREHERIRDLCERGGQELVAAERLAVGVDHTALSADVLAQWNLPEPIREAVRSHHGPHEHGACLSRVVEMSDWLAVAHGVPAQKWLALPGPGARECLERAGLGARAERILDQFEGEYEAARSFFH